MSPFPNRYFIVMELANGGTLLHHFPLSKARVREVMKDLLRAVVYLHGQWVVHRDIKPHNILVCTPGLRDAHWLVKIAAFGYTTYYERPGLTGGYGTIYYMALEGMGSYRMYHCAPYSLGSDLRPLGSLGVESYSNIHPMVATLGASTKLIDRDAIETIHAKRNPDNGKTSWQLPPQKTTPNLAKLISPS